MALELSEKLEMVGPRRDVKKYKMPKELRAPEGLVKGGRVQYRYESVDSDMLLQGETKQDY